LNKRSSNLTENLEMILISGTCKLSFNIGLAFIDIFSQAFQAKRAFIEFYCFSL